VPAFFNAGPPPKGERNCPAPAHQGWTCGVPTHRIRTRRTRLRTSGENSEMCCTSNPANCYCDRPWGTTACTARFDNTAREGRSVRPGLRGASFTIRTSSSQKVKTANPDSAAGIIKGEWKQINLQTASNDQLAASTESREREENRFLQLFFLGNWAPVLGNSLATGP